MEKIFHAPEAAPAAANPATAMAPAQGTPPSDSKPQEVPPSTPAKPATSVDVVDVLSKKASQKNGGGNWQTSIVDLLRLLDLDSSLNARKELAIELDVHTGADGSAEENIALHQAVMQKLAENGGTVPASFKG